MTATSDALDYLTEIVECELYRPDRHVLVEQRLVEAAFPATGELDSRPAGDLGVSRGEFIALAAVLCGNQPIGGETTAAQAQRHFSVEGKRIEVSLYGFDGSYHFHRIK